MSYFLVLELEDLSGYVSSEEKQSSAVAEYSAYIQCCVNVADRFDRQIGT